MLRVPHHKITVMIGLRFSKNRRFVLSGTGFTLIELLISVAILGILSAGVLIAINPVKRQNQAKDAKIKSDIGQIATAVQSYFSSGGVGSYPVGLATLVTNSDLKHLPTPPNSASYKYSVTAGGGAVCDGSLSSPCTYARISELLSDPAVAGNVWCWQSSTGKGQETSVGACTP